VAGRPSLPGVDELFGSTPARPRRERPAEHRAAPSPDAVDDDALAHARELLAAEDELVHEARERSGPDAAPSADVAAFLAWLVRAGRARSVVEIGAAGGITGAWLLSALPDGGVLTSIEPDPARHELASRALKRVRAAARARSIHGDPDTVLPRLADGGYDLVLLQTEGRLPGELDHARRLLRPGGTLVVRRVLHPDEHGERNRALVTTLAEDDGFDTVVLPLDGGLLLATRTDDEHADEPTA
jgi:predicted O-methyltransferase YrrM